MNITTDAKVPTSPSFSKGAGAGKTGGDTPASITHPIERSECMGSSKQPAFGPKKYKEYGAASPSLSASTSERKE